MADYGIKVATENGDVNSVDLKDYEFWTKYPMVKVKTSGSGTATLAVSSGSGSFSIEVDDDPTTFDPIIFARGEVYSAVNDVVIDSLDLPFREASSTAVIYSAYNFVRDTGKIYYRGEVAGGTNGTYNLDYEYIILYDKIG